MKTEVKLQRGARETVYEVDLPVVPEGYVILTPASPEIWTRVKLSYIDISPASGPVQVLVVSS